MLAVLRHHAGRVHHRLLLGIAERSVELAGRTEQEIAGERARQPAEAGIGPLLPRVDAGILRLRLRGRGRRLCRAPCCGRWCRRRRRAPAPRNARAIATSSLGLERNGVQVVALKRLAGAGIGVAVGGELALALHGVAAEAGILDGLRGFRMEGLGLARKLREEDRIAAGEAFRRCAPGPVGRDVDHLVVGARLGHVELQAGAAGAVAADALRRRHHLRARVRLARRRPDMVVGFRWHADDGRAGRPRLAQQPEEAREQRRVGRLGRRPALGLGLGDRLVKALEQRRRDEGLAEEHQRIAALALDVAQRREGRVVARRCVAVRAVQAVAHIGIVVGRGRRPVRPPVLSRSSRTSPRTSRHRSRRRRAP